MNVEHLAIEAGVGVAPSGFRFGETGDFNHDDTTDILFQNPTNGYVAEWIMNAGQLTNELGLGFAPTGFQIAGVGDTNHDRTTDILFKNTSSGAVDA
jgi:hypothetical protein